MSCSLPAAANQATPVQNPVVKATDTAQPKAIAATTTATTMQPTTTPEPTQEITPTQPLLPQADFGGVTFSYDSQIASSVASQEVAAVNEGQGAPWEIQPATTKLTFNGYPVSNSNFPPEILIFPVKEYQTVNDQAGKEIDSLRQAIAVHPHTFPSQGLPFLPPWNAAQMMHAKVTYFPFVNGRGVRYLTQYGQDIAPVNNKYLIYTYQGLTSDGKYYISAILPVTNAILPADYTDVPGGDIQKFSDNYQNYLTDIQGKLDAQADDSFVPSLTLLDNMIQSIAVNK